MKRKLFIGIIVRLLPAILMLSWLYISNNTWELLGCTGNIKAFSGCYYKGTDVTWLISTGLFLGYILWLPLLLLGILTSGKYIQKTLLLKRWIIPEFGYKEAYTLSFKAVFIWIFVSLIGACAILVAQYPEQPQSIIGWFIIILVWVPLWSIVSYVLEKVNIKNA